MIVKASAARRTDSVSAQCGSLSLRAESAEDRKLLTDLHLSLFHGNPIPTSAEVDKLREQRDSIQEQRDRLRKQLDSRTPQLIESLSLLKEWMSKFGRTVRTMCDGDLDVRTEAAIRDLEDDV